MKWGIAMPAWGKEGGLDFPAAGGGRGSGWAVAGCPADLRWGGMGSCHQEFAGLRKKGFSVKAEFSVLQMPSGLSFIPKPVFSRHLCITVWCSERFAGMNYCVCFPPES